MAMTCKHCGAMNPSVHFTEMAGGRTVESHLCESCFRDYTPPSTRVLGAADIGTMFDKELRSVGEPRQAASTVNRAQPNPPSCPVDVAAPAEKREVAQCPHCGARFRIDIRHIGRDARCKCGRIFKLATVVAQGSTAGATQQSSVAIDDLMAKLRTDTPTSISKFPDGFQSHFENQVRLFASWAARGTFPSLTAVALVRKDGSGPANRIVVMSGSASAQSELLESPEGDSSLREALPGKGWGDLRSPGTVSNYSIPGCTMTSRTEFDTIVSAIRGGLYNIHTAISINGKSSTGTPVQLLARISAPGTATARGEIASTSHPTSAPPLGRELGDKCTPSSPATTTAAALAAAAQRKSLAAPAVSRLRPQAMPAESEPMQQLDALRREAVAAGDMAMKIGLLPLWVALLLAVSALMGHRMDLGGIAWLSIGTTIIWITAGPAAVFRAVGKGRLYAAARQVVLEDVEAGRGPYTASEREWILKWWASWFLKRRDVAYRVIWRTIKIAGVCVLALPATVVAILLALPKQMTYGNQTAETVFAVSLLAPLGILILAILVGAIREALSPRSGPTSDTRATAERRIHEKELEGR